MMTTALLLCRGNALPLMWQSKPSASYREVAKKNCNRSLRQFRPEAVTRRRYVPMSKIDVPEGYTLIFRATRTDPKTGRVQHARHYGKKAWPILVPTGQLKLEL